MICPYSVNGKKSLGCLFRQIDITTSDTIATDNQLAFFPNGQIFALLINDIKFCIDHGAANDNFPFGLHNSSRTAHGTFRRAVDIQYHAVRAQFLQFFKQSCRKCLSTDIIKIDILQRLPAFRYTQYAQQKRRRAKNSIYPHAFYAF